MRISVMAGLTAMMMVSAGAQTLQYTPYTTTPTGQPINGNNLTNLQAPNLQGLATAGILTNGNGKVDFDGMAISSDGLGNLTALSFLGNGGQLTGLSGSQLVGPISVGSLPLEAETNFDTRGWTNQSARGIFANLFSGAFSGNGAALSGIPQTAILPTLSPIPNIVGAPNWGTNVEQLITNQAFTFSLPVGYTSSAYNYTLVVVTNNSGSLIAITSPGSWAVLGTPNCTNYTKVLIDSLPGWTNANYLPVK